jgi:hypothetical protein
MVIFSSSRAGEVGAPDVSLRGLFQFEKQRQRSRLPLTVVSATD